LNLSYHDSSFADLYEDTIYNALLGGVALDGKTFYYPNPLDANRLRDSWHSVPCCVGNIPRTLLAMPRWMYSRGPDSLYVNLYMGSTVKLENVAGLKHIEMVQKTNYPWDGKVAITVNPRQTKNFTVFVRVPDRTTSTLYTPESKVGGLKSLAVNGKKISPKIENGYAAITREWQAGDNWRAKSFSVQLRSPTDVVLLQAPPWWTLKKVLWIAAALGFVTLAAFVWVAVLFVVTGTAVGVGSDYHNDFSLPGTESQQALDVLKRRAPAQAVDGRAVPPGRWFAAPELRRAG